MSVCRLLSSMVCTIVAGTVLCDPNTAQGAVPDGLYAASYGRISRKGSVTPGSGDDWSFASEAKNVTAMTMHGGNLYVTSYGTLWRCDALGSPSTPALAQFIKVGEAHNVVAMASFNGNLYAVSNGALWMRGEIGPASGNSWTHVGDALNVTAMVAHNDALYVTSNNALWKRGALGPGTGNSWTKAGDAIAVTAMVSHGGYLYAASGGSLWRRGAIGPNSGNDWTKIGPAASIASLASVPPANNMATASVWKSGTMLQTGMKIGILGSVGWDYQKDSYVNITPSFVTVRSTNVGSNANVGYVQAPVLVADSSLLTPENVFTVTVLPPVAGEVLASGIPAFQKILLQAPGGGYIGGQRFLLGANATQANAHLLLYYPTISTLSNTGLSYWNLVNNTWKGAVSTEMLCVSMRDGSPKFYSSYDTPSSGCAVTFYILQ